MQTTKYKIIGLILLVIVIVFSLRQNQVPKVEENIRPVKQQEKEFNTATTVIIKQAQKSKKEQKEEPNSTYIYSEDPIVENHIISLKYSVCQTYFIFQNSPYLNFKSLYNSKIQHDYFNKASANCEKLNKDHPEYLLNINYKERITLMQSKTATSKIGQMLEFYKKPINTIVSNQEIEELYGILGNEYPELISYPFIAGMKYEVDTIIPDLKELLFTTNTQYVAKITNLSRMYLSCQLNNDCTMGSSTMMSLCLIETNFCVASFDELFNERLSQGVQADVLLALPYFKRLYQVE